MQEPEQQNTESLTVQEKNFVGKHYKACGHGGKSKFKRCWDEDDIDYLDFSEWDCEMTHDDRRARRTKKKINRQGS